MGYLCISVLQEVKLKEVQIYTYLLVMRSFSLLFVYIYLFFFFISLHLRQSRARPLSLNLPLQHLTYICTPYWMSPGITGQVIKIFSDVKTPWLNKQEPRM